jgi:DNA-binding SARP family transcriptional activator
MRIAALCLFLLFWVSPAQAEVGDAMDYFNLGLESSLTNKKIKYFTKALELNPDLTSAYEKRGLLYFYKEEYEKAIRDFGTYLDLAPAKAEAYRMLGMGYLKSGIYQSAIHNFTRAIEMEPELARAYANRAETYREIGNHDEAIHDATKAIEFGGDPRTISIALMTRSKVHRKLGRMEQAFEDSTAAMRADPFIWGISYSDQTTRKREAPVVLIGLSCVVLLGLKHKVQLRTNEVPSVRILKSKLLPPRTSDTIKRERLLFLLASIPKRRLATVVAGAGYGKTTAVAQVSANLNVTTVWYRLNESDRDFVTFLSYLIAGTRQYFPEIGGDTAGKLEGGKNLNRELEPILTTFLSEIEEAVEEDLIIILDDYHTVQDSQEIRKAVAFLLKHATPHLHLILISRANIDLPLSRLQAMREIIEITEEDLAFTVHETSQLFSQLFNITLKQSTAETVHQKTGGWISGLMLLYHSLKGKSSQEIERTLQRLPGTPKTISRYLEENVFDSLSEETRKFLLLTSILPRLHVEFCDRLLNIDNSLSIINHLEKNHLFTYGLDEERQLFSYHHLFRTFLRKKLAHELEIDELDNLHNDAIVLLEEMGESEEGLSEYLTAEQLNQDELQRNRKNIMVDVEQDLEAKDSSPALKVHLLGKFRLFADTQEILAKSWKSKKARTLFQFLLYSRSRGYVNKEVLMELLWPEEDPQKTAKRLHVALASLRKTLQPDLQRGTPSSYISRDNDSYTIDVGKKDWVDIDNFIEELNLAKQQENLEKSIAHYLNAESMYKGDFLEEDLYSDWCIEARENFRSEYLQLLREIIEYYDGQKDYKKCIEYVQKYLKIDKYAEDIYQLLMTYYANTGNKALVVKTFEKCNDIIENDLNCPISNETEALYQELISS